MKVLNLVPLLHFQNESVFNKYKNEDVVTISPFSEQKFINSKEIKCEIGSLSYILAMIAQSLKPDCEFFKSLDTELLSGESNISEEECEEILEFLKDCDIVLVDDNLLNYDHDNENVKACLGIISRKTKARVLNLNQQEFNFEGKVNDLKELDSFDGSVVFKHTKDDKFIGGTYFAMAAKIKDNDKVIVKTANINMEKVFHLDKNMKGTIAFIGDLDSYNENFIQSYCFEVADIKRVD